MGRMYDQIRCTRRSGRICLLQPYKIWMIAAVVLTLPAAGQGTAARGPRTADGKPNLNGIWQVLTTANWDLQGHAAAAGPMIPLGAIGAMPPGQGVVEGEEIPYKPEALATKKANFADRLKLDPEVKCYLPGVPRATYMPFPFQIVQTPQFILISYEYANAARTIYMDDPGPAPIDSWMGQSVGHWEGDTLVVDVTGLNDSELVRPRRRFSFRRAARGRALHPPRRRHADV